MAPPVEDASLDRLKETLLPLRKQPYENTETRGATPVFGSAKTQLRSFIESRLSRLTPAGDETLFRQDLNSNLEKANLQCTNAIESCDGPRGFNALGFVGQVEVHFLLAHTFLAVQTGLGIQCGYDESAYLYEWKKDRWERTWESEQNTYRENEYRPQWLHKVLVSPAAPNTGDRLVLTLGVNPWCTSNWQGGYYRLWRIGSGGPKLLLDGSEVVYLGADHPMQGRVSFNDALVEFRAHSVDSSVHNREAVRRFMVNGDQVIRTNPIALSPRSFVDEWLNHSWSESFKWSEEPTALLATWHKKLHADYVSGEFVAPTQRCSKTLDLWQVGIGLVSPKTDSPETYFLVRWKQPHQFTMVLISSQPSSDCIQKDEKADEAKTLFVP
jgi:hypothetical protein